MLTEELHERKDKLIERGYDFFVNKFGYRVEYYGHFIAEEKRKTEFKGGTKEKQRAIEAYFSIACAHAETHWKTKPPAFTSPYDDDYIRRPLQRIRNPAQGYNNVNV